MQISKWIPAKMQNAYERTREFCSQLPNKIQTLAIAIFRGILRFFVIEAWVNRTVKATTKFDYILLIASVALSAIGTYFSVTHFGIATLPLALCGGATIVGLSGYIVHIRVKKYYSQIASEHIKKMEEEAKKISNRNQNFVSLETELTALKKPEFSYLTDSLKNLYDQTTAFKEAATKPTIEDQKVILKAHIDSIQSGNPQDQEILKNLKQQIDADATDKKYLENLETHKQKLKQFQSPIAISHQLELTKQSNKLLKIAQGANFFEIQKNYLEQLQGLQKSLVWNFIF